MKKFNSYFILSVLCILSTYFLVSEAHQYAFAGDGWEASPGKSIDKFFDLTNLIMVQINDQLVDVSGYLMCKVDFPKHLQSIDFKSRTLRDGVWSVSPIAYHSNDFCKSLQDSDRMWYNITKNFNACPPKTGDKWVIDKQTVSLVLDLPLVMDKFEATFEINYLPPFVKPDLEYDFKMCVDAIAL